MGNFPETSPQSVTATVTLAILGTISTTVVLMKTKKLGTITDIWGMTDVAAAADGDLAVSFLNRGTAGAGTAIIDALNGAGTAWVGTTVKVGTAENNTGIAANSYIVATVTRDSGSTATAHVLTVGATFIPGSPAAVGSIGA